MYSNKLLTSKNSDEGTEASKFARQLAYEEKGERWPCRSIVMDTAAAPLILVLQVNTVETMSGRLLVLCIVTVVYSQPAKPMFSRISLQTVVSRCSVTSSLS